MVPLIPFQLSASGTPGIGLKIDTIYRVAPTAGLGVGIAFNSVKSSFLTLSSCAIAALKIGSAAVKSSSASLFYASITTLSFSNYAYLTLALFFLTVTSSVIALTVTRISSTFS